MEDKVLYGYPPKHNVDTCVVAKCPECQKATAEVLSVAQQFPLPPEVTSFARKTAEGLYKVAEYFNKRHDKQNAFFCIDGATQILMLAYGYGEISKRHCAMMDVVRAANSLKNNSCNPGEEDFGPLFRALENFESVYGPAAVGAA